MERLGEDDFHADRKKNRKRNDADNKKEDEDMAMFLNDIEEDPEIRANINLYKVSFI